jgi:hypothetical protein
MPEKFQSERSNGFGAILLTVTILVLFLSLGLPIINEQSLSILELGVRALFSALVFGLFVWCWTSTYYEINMENLHIISGPFRIKVQINDITSIITNQKSVGGFIKPTLSWDCIVIEHGENNSISISPQHQDKFIRTLTDLNKTIKIK